MEIREKWEEGVESLRKIAGWKCANWEVMDDTELHKPQMGRQAKEEALLHCPQSTLYSVFSNSRVWELK